MSYRSTYKTNDTCIYIGCPNKTEILNSYEKNTYKSYFPHIHPEDIARHRIH